MEAISSLREGKVQAVHFTKASFYPGDSLQFTYDGQRYQLSATGLKKQEKNTGAVHVENYKLYLSVVTMTQHKTQLLVVQPQFDENMIKLLFIGDVDGDNKPDLIIGTSPHYNMEKPTLYLSGAAAANEIIKPVGAHRFVGC